MGGEGAGWEGGGDGPDAHHRCRRKKHPNRTATTPPPGCAHLVRGEDDGNDCKQPRRAEGERARDEEVQVGFARVRGRAQGAGARVNGPRALEPRRGARSECRHSHSWCQCSAGGWRGGTPQQQDKHAVHRCSGARCNSARVHTCGATAFVTTSPRANGHFFCQNFYYRGSVISLSSAGSSGQHTHCARLRCVALQQQPRVAKKGLTWTIENVKT